ncbi:MFS transporter [Jiangella gansuensis]|uniref:MFS transporter n=1 Tax=Jiangella gansuensis TaxID=281473 RepID=UPI001B7FEAA6
MAYLIGLAPFGAGAVIAALSPTMTVLLVGRAVQGFGGGMLAGLGYAVVQSAFPARLWARATALVSAMRGVGTLAGPAMRGLFAQLGAWRWAFGVLAVLGVVVAVMVPRALPRSAGDGTRQPVPYVSLALLTVATALISIAILAIGTVSEAFTPLFGQRLAGLEPLVAGFLGAAVSLWWSVTMLASSGAERAETVLRMRIAGPAVLALGLAVAGAGIGLAFPHVVVAVMGSTPDPVEAGKASAGVNTVELIGLAFGSAVGGLLVNLGAPSMLTSARYLLFGLAATALVGVVVAARAARVPATAD